VENKTKRKDENERGTHGGREKRPSQWKKSASEYIGSEGPQPPLPLSLNK
jgi:hypothetical protein